jgi:hypothetical protein
MPAHITTPGREWLRSVLVIVLGCGTAAALVLRIVSIAEPLGIDQSLWASAARAISRHQLLYRDVWEQRPPGIYAIYVAAFHVFGWRPAAVAWIDILAAVATTILLYASVARLAGRPAGAFASFLYAALTMPAWLYPHGGFLERSVCETFIVVCVAAAAWCAVRLREGSSLLWAAGMGLFSGMAVVLKPNAGLYLPALLVWMACYSRERGGAWIRGAVFTTVCAAAVAPVLTLLWLWRDGLLPDARVAVIEFNRYYVAAGFTFGGYAVDFSKAVWLRVKTDPLWLAGGVATLAALYELVRRRRLPPLAGLAVLWGGAAALVIVVNGARLFNTYFIQAFAPLVVLGTWMLTDASAPSPGRRTLRVITAALMLFLLIHRHYPAKVLDWASADFDALRGRLDATSYLDRFGGYANGRGYSARANDELARFVRAHSDFDDRIFLFGINGAGIYFASDRLPAHRFLRVNFFVPSEFPDPHFTLGAVVAELATRRPRYLIFEQLHSSSEMGQSVDALQFRPEIRQLLAPYTLETTIEDFSLYRRRDVTSGHGSTDVLSLPPARQVSRVPASAVLSFQP